MFARRFFAAALAGALLLAGCTGGAGADPMAGDAAHIDAALVAGLDEQDARTVADAVNRFGFELLGQLSDGTENTVVSPLSVATMLAMVLAGTGGDTAEQIAGVLHLDQARDPRPGALLGQLAGAGDVSLTVANALWAQSGTPFEDDYLTHIRRTFGATVTDTDLGSQTAADTIDSWVQERTDGRIDRISDALRLPDARARLVLVNAVHFLGGWTHPFDSADTADAGFTLPDGTEVTVPTMRYHPETAPDPVQFRVVQRRGYQLLQLPYGATERFEMQILLPAPDTDLPAVLGATGAEEWQAAAASTLPESTSEVRLPRLELEWESTLDDPLAALGMSVAFGTEADFRPMSPEPQWLETVAHRTYLRVDEEGTEAAAVAAGYTAISGHPPFVVDRPFAFAITDQQTGTFLFLGVIADPRG